MPNDIVPIGRYKGQPLEVMMADAGYVNWILGQAWFLEKHVELARLLRMGRLEEPQDTPEHNAMIARLIDQRPAMEALANRIWPDSEITIGESHFGQRVEPKGADIEASLGFYTMLIEVKPLMGDDYPTVIRKLKVGLSMDKIRPRKGVAIVKVIEPSNLTIEQVKRQFQLAGLTLISEDEFFGLVEDWIKLLRLKIEKEIKILRDEVDKLLEQKKFEEENNYIDPAFDEPRYGAWNNSKVESLERRIKFLEDYSFSTSSGA